MQNDFPSPFEGKGRVRFSLGEIIVDEGRRLRGRRLRRRRRGRGLDGGVGLSENGTLGSGKRPMGEGGRRYPRFGRERERDGGPVTKLRIKNTKKDGRGGKRWWRKVGGGRVDLRQRVAREQWLVISSPWNKPSRPCVAPFNRARRLLHAPKTEGVSRGHRFSTA